MTDLELLAQRLQRVESQYRRLQRAVMACAIVIGAALMMGQASPPGSIQGRRSILSATAQQATEPIEDKIRARQFVLVDANGKERASMVTDGAGAAFMVFFDQFERPRAEMSVSPYGPALTFYDGSGKPRTIIGSTTMVSSHVADASGVVERHPASSIVLFDGQGKLLWRNP